MSKEKSASNKSCFWKCLQSAHIYNTKAEAIFKAIIITISWIGGVRLTEKPETITREIGATFYLFALALVMEYLIKLITSNNIIPKILPFCLCSINILVFLWTSAIFLDKPFTSITFEHMHWITVVSLGIIWFDVITMILIEPSKIEHIENNLKNINGDGND